MGWRPDRFGLSQAKSVYRRRQRVLAVGGPFDDCTPVGGCPARPAPSVGGHLTSDRSHRVGAWDDGPEHTRRG